MQKLNSQANDAAKRWDDAMLAMFNALNRLGEIIDRQQERIDELTDAVNDLLQGKGEST